MPTPDILSVRIYGHYDYQCLSGSQHLRTVPTNDVDDSKTVEDVYISFKIASITEDIATGSDTLIIDEIHTSFDSTSDDVDEIVEPNTPIVHSKPFKPPCAKYSFMVIPIDSSFRESPEFLAKI